MKRRISPEEVVGYVTNLGESFWAFNLGVYGKWIKPMNLGYRLKAKLVHIKHDIASIKLYASNFYYRLLKNTKNLALAARRSTEHFKRLIKQESPKTIALEFCAFLKHKYHINRREALKLLQAVLVFCAFLGCYYTIKYINDIEWVLKVEAGGRVLGFVENEFDFWQAEQEARERIAQAEPDEGKSIYILPKFSICALGGRILADERELADEIMQLWSDKIKKATGVYVSGRFYGATTEAEKLRATLEEIKQENAKNLKEKGQILFLNKVEVKEGIYPLKSVKDFNTKILPSLSSYERVKECHEVAKGATVESILAEYGMTQAEFEKLNGKNVAPEEGAVVTVLKRRPLLEVKVVKTERGVEKIPFKSLKVESMAYPYGVSFYKQRGREGVAEVTYSVTYVDDVEKTRAPIASQTITEPQDECVVVGKKQSSYFYDYGTTEATLEEANFIWPVEGKRGYVSCYFGGAARHRGIDICAEAGTGILASDEGEVISAGWEGTFGKSVVIRHGNGLITRYAHNSEIFVRVGQKVGQGELIAKMGRTGNASGNHLHFEVIKNGALFDPLPQIS